MEMAKFTAWARVLTPDDERMKEYEAGVIGKRPGLALKTLLEWSGGAYEYKMILPPGFRENLRKVAELTSDETLLAIARRGEFQLSLEHLRGADLQSLITFGARLGYEPGEAGRLGLPKSDLPLDPKTTIVDNRR
jgi:hypothetical protein